MALTQQEDGSITDESGKVVVSAKGAVKEAAPPEPVIEDEPGADVGEAPKTSGKVKTHK